MKDSSWKLIYTNFVESQQKLRETLCTLGNGYFATRGAFCEVSASKTHYPGTYIAGVYNKLGTKIGNKIFYNEDLVNCPNWLFITFKIEDGEWFLPSSSNLIYYYQELNMKEGVLRRKLIFRDGEGRRTKIETLRIVHMKYHHLGVIQYNITPLNYSAHIVVKSCIDGSVLNKGVERYSQLNCKHLVPITLGQSDKTLIYLYMQTSQSKIKIAISSKLKAKLENRDLKTNLQFFSKHKKIVGQYISSYVSCKATLCIEKIACIYTSKDKSVKDPLKEAVNSLKKNFSFNSLYKSHKLAWRKLWDKFDVKIEGDTFSQKALRFHIFSLLQTVSPHTRLIDTGIPARGLHGEAYRGHIFWDEVFIMHFYDLHMPAISKNLLLYRYRRLEKARYLAHREGYKGAMFPWQSGSTGEEETQKIHLNPLSGKWGPDYSRFQRHVSFAVAYNVWNYFIKTQDLKFLCKYGAEIFLSVAHFARSLLKYDSKDNKYHTQKVMGPDEFHEKYPHQETPGLRDNAYTNLFIAWLLLKSQDLIKILPSSCREKILKKINLNIKDIQEWKKVVPLINIVINDKGIVAQFDGFFKLKELDWSRYRKKYKDIRRLDRILKKEGISPDNFQAIKQADFLMIFYLFSFEEVQKLFDILGYKFTKKDLLKNYQYYIKRTSHGSTLSYVVHCYIAHLLSKYKQAWRWFQEVLKSDIYDIQRGPTSEGIHTGVMGGSLDIVFRRFAGIQILEDKIKINPHLPQIWSKIEFKFCFRKKWFKFSLGRDSLCIFIQDSKSRTLEYPVIINNKPYFLRSKFRYKFIYKKIRR